DPVRRRHRPGHDLHPVHDLRPLGTGRRGRPARAPADLPAGRVGRARRRRDLGQHPPGLRRRPGPGRPRRVPDRGRRHHQPARDHGRLGPGHRRADPPRHRLAGHPDPGDLRRARRPRRRGRALPLADGPAAGHLLRGAEGALDPRQRRGRPRAGGARRAGLRDDGHLGAVERDRRRRGRAALHRPDQRLAHPADEHRHPRVGPPALRGDRRPDGDPAGDPVVVGAVRHHPGPRHLQRRPRVRHPRRPAGRDVRPGLPGGRRGQEHLRHRQLRAAQHRHREGRVEERPAHHGRLQDRRRPADLLPRGLDRRHRLAGAVGARQPRDHLVGPRDRGARQVGRRQRRRLLRPRVLRPVRPALAFRRPRRDRRPDPLRQQGPPGACGARGDGVPDARGHRRHERRLGRAADHAKGRRRHGRQRGPHAVPGRPARRGGHPPGGRRDHRPRRRLRRRPRRRVLGLRAGHPRQLGPGQGLDAADGPEPARRDLRPVEEGGHAHVRLGL
ncbi:MAG: Glycerol kinase, partial [uncultured Actinomycetospora sp.]